MNIKQAKNGLICGFSASIPDELQTDLTRLIGEEMDPIDFHNK